MSGFCCCWVVSVLCVCIFKTLNEQKKLLQNLSMICIHIYCYFSFTCMYRCCISRMSVSVSLCASFECVHHMDYIGVMCV